MNKRPSKNLLFKITFFCLLLTFSKIVLAADHYTSFKEMMMDAALTAGRDFQIERKDLDSKVFSIAIHGGVIEPKTDFLAQEFALRFGLSHYIFRSFFRGPGGNNSNYLHVTATKFDDPKLLAMAQKSRYCVSFHGQKAVGKVLCVGGANQALRRNLHVSLQSSGFTAQAGVRVDANPLGNGWDLEHCQALAGIKPENVVNRCQNQGLQLEMSSSLLLLLTQKGAESLQDQFYESLEEALRK